MDALTRAFLCRNRLSGKHLMRLIRPVTEWRTYRCSWCGFRFNPDE